MNSIALIGASFETGNLGVGALAWSCLKLILNRWPGAEVCCLGSGMEVDYSNFQIDGHRTQVAVYPIRFCRNILEPNHIVRVKSTVLWRKLFCASGKGTKMTCAKDAVLNADLFCDITGGDSFSDIYGMQRFVRGYLIKRLCQSMGKPFVMLPQTYGPFERPLARLLARQVLRHSNRLFSRDQQSLAEIRNTAGDGVEVEVVPDVAFILDPIRPDTEQTGRIEQLKSDGRQIVGLNVSGLLYNGGYTRKNQFGLKCDYRALVRNIVSSFAQQEDCVVLLVPHVVTKDFAVENDLAVCQELWRSLPTAEQKKTIVLDGGYDQNQIKYLIGLCDLFVGARMHSTIAALSQYVPAVGMAYSKKFAGVFQTAGVEEYVVDMRQMDEAQILDRINELHQARGYTRRHLMEAMPKVQKKVMSLFDAF
jgi:polysaccharide pyruvyl transferase WcaK-like protein